MTENPDRSSAEMYDFVAPTDYILVDDARENSQRNRTLRQQEMRKLLVRYGMNYVELSGESTRQTRLQRMMAMGAAALHQLDSPESKAPSAETVARQLNEILPFLGATQEPPKTVSPIETKHITKWLQEAKTNLQMRGGAQPHDIDSWPYYELVKGLEEHTMFFQDLTASALSQSHVE